MSTIGNFRIVERLGEGGMGEVFRAEDTMLERQVALKTLKAEMAARPELVERFRVEAIALAKMHHRHIAAVYAFFRDGDRHHIAMQFIPGRTLEAALAERGRLPWRTAAAVALDVLAALEHAHGLGVIHRDLKPANLMIDPEGRAVVMDFGIARVLARARQTRSGTLVGTLEYIAPEIIKGRPADARADLYALGIVLYEMVTGRLPFDARTDYELMRAHTETTPARPSVRAAALGIELPAALEAVIMRALAKQPEERYDSAAAMARALSRVVDITPTAEPSRAARQRSLDVRRDRRIGWHAISVDAVRTAISAAHTSLRSLVRAIELPRIDAGAGAWQQWLRCNPGLAGAALAGAAAMVVIAAAVWPHSPATMPTAAGAGLMASGGASPMTGGATALKPAVLIASKEPANVTTTPQSAPQPADFKMPPTPAANVSIETPKAEAPAAVASEPVASAGRTPASEASPRVASASPPPSPPPKTNGEPGWYVRR